MKCPDCKRGTIQRNFYGGECNYCSATFDDTVLDMMTSKARYEAKRAKVHKSPTLGAAGKRGKDAKK
jgi:ribosomal protein L37AE/L43A